MGGDDPGYVALTELYDGTSWTATSAMNTARGGSGGGGIQTSALVWGGHTGPGGPGAQAKTESWDGSSWTETADLSSTRNACSGTGASNASSVCFGGDPQVKATEEFTSSTNTITAAAWAAGGNMGTARDKIAGFGSQTSAIAANGDTYPPSSGRYTAGCEEYNGTSWTGIASNNTSTAASAASKLSPSSAGSVFGGEPVSARHEYWNGSAWSEQTDANTPSNSSGGAGTQTASIKMGGVPGAPSNTGTEEWNGSSWSNQNDMPHGVTNSPGSGTQTAALIFGGNNPAISTTAEYDGTNWTTSGNMILGREQLGGSGTQTDTLAFGGRVAPPTDGKTETEGYDGTTWSTRPSLGTGRRQQGSAGVVSSASLSFGGEPDTTATEEFTGETTAANVTNFTTS